MTKILIGVLVLLLAVVGAAYLLPSKFDVARSIDIRDDAEDIFVYVNTLEKWPEWTPWTVAKYPQMKQSFEGPKSGTGAKMVWLDPDNRNGSMIITSSEAKKGITYDLDFEGFTTSKGRITLEQKGAAVTVTMGLTGDLGNNPIARYMGLMMDGMMGAEFQEGLAKLNDVVEKKGS